jgi:hypothetical protein
MLFVSPQQGDLKSVVMHKIAMRNVKSNFPVCTSMPREPFSNAFVQNMSFNDTLSSGVLSALGTHITGVDANTYSITGDNFSTIGECVLM